MPQTIKKTDTQIHHDVIEELKWDSRVDETEVGVQVAAGVVTLTGTVTSWAKRVAAQEAARRVIGVLDVANDLKVKAAGGLSRTDTEIAQAVRQALEWDVFVPNEKITSTVTDGWVTLEGPVTDRVAWFVPDTVTVMGCSMWALASDASWPMPSTTTV